MHNVIKIHSLIKNHWFGLLMSAFALLYAALMLIIVSAPREDLLERGFIPCTKIMMDEILACPQGKIGCMSKIIVRNNLCDIGVIAGGFSAWIKGKQPRPWSNYFFTPELNAKPSAESDEVLEEYYQQNPNIAEQMEKIHQKRLDLESKLTEKNNDEIEFPQ
jgi:hypothetical protein